MTTELQAQAYALRGVTAAIGKGLKTQVDILEEKTGLHIRNGKESFYAYKETQYKLQLLTLEILAKELDKWHKSLEGIKDTILTLAEMKEGEKEND